MNDSNSALQSLKNVTIVRTKGLSFFKLFNAKFGWMFVSKIPSKTCSIKWDFNRLLK